MVTANSLAGGSLSGTSSISPQSALYYEAQGIVWISKNYAAITRLQRRTAANSRMHH